MRHDISQESSKGVKARQAMTTPEQRSAIASKAARARWKNHHKHGVTCFCHCGRRESLHQGLHHPFKCNLEKNI